MKSEFLGHGWVHDEGVRDEGVRDGQQGVGGLRYGGGLGQDLGLEGRRGAEHRREGRPRREKGRRLPQLRQRELASHDAVLAQRPRIRGPQKMGGCYPARAC